MGKEEIKKDLKQSLENSVDNIGEVTKKSTANILEVIAEHGVGTIMEYIDKGIKKLKEKITGEIDDKTKK